MPKFLLSLLWIALLTLGCRWGKKSHHDEDAPAPTFGLIKAEDRVWWIDRVSRKLRNGQGVRAGETFEGMEPQQIINRMMQDDRFDESMLDFNLYFLGFKSDDIRLDNGRFNRDPVQDHGVEIQAALEVRKGGDFFKLMSIDPPVYLVPLLSQSFDFTDNKLSAVEVTQNDYDTLYREAPLLPDKWLADLDNLPADVDEEGVYKFCGSMFEALFRLYSKTHYFVPDNISDMMRRSNYWFGFERKCYNFASKRTAANRQALKVSIEVMPARFVEMNSLLAQLEPRNYMPKSIRELKTLDAAAWHVDISRVNMKRFWDALPNSSTNMNRKRASYILKRFYCDDLTPVSVEQPAQHASGNRHADDPGCQSCHYKLDPMAGFFRNHGYKGIDFTKGNFGSSSTSSSEKYIYFDDTASAKLSEYVKNWRSSDDPNRLNIGYIRSLEHPELNDYSENSENPQLSNFVCDAASLARSEAVLGT